MTARLVKITFPLLLCILGRPTAAQSVKDLLDQGKKEGGSALHFFKLAEGKASANAEKLLVWANFCAYYSRKNDLDSTLYFGRKAADLGLALDSMRHVYTALRNMDIVCNANGLYDMASQYAIEGLKLAESRNNQEWISNFNRMQSLNQHDFESYEQGIVFGKKAYEASLKVNPPIQTLITYALNAIAINFDDWNKPDSALFYHYKIFDYLQPGDSVNYYFSYNNIGNTFMKQKKYKEANAWLQRSLLVLNKAAEGADSLDFYYDYATTITNLATIATLQNDFPTAEKWFEKAAYYSIKSGSAEKLRDYYQQQYLYHKKINDPVQLALFQEKYIQLRDSVFNSERASTFASLEKRYQSEKKEAALQILNSENKRQKTMLFAAAGFLLLLSGIGYLLFNRQRLRQKTQMQKEIIRQQDITAHAVIKAEENERQRMSTALHDNLGQLLSVVKMNMQTLKDRIPADEKTIEIQDKTLNLVEDSIREMRMVSHQMVPANVLRSGLGNALKSLVEQIDSNKLKIYLNAEGLGSHVDSNVQLVLYRIFQEAINNVIKHSRADRLHISVLEEKGFIYASIEDNGVGFDTKKVAAYSGIGLDNIRTRVAFLKGNMEINSEPGNGTMIAIQVPAK